MGAHAQSNLRNGHSLRSMHKRSSGNGGGEDDFVGTSTFVTEYQMKNLFIRGMIY